MSNNEQAFAPLASTDVQLYSLMGDMRDGSGGQTFFLSLREAVRVAALRLTYNPSGMPCLRVFRPAEAAGGACYVDFLCDGELQLLARMSAARLDHLEKELRAGQQISPRFEEDRWDGVPV